MAIKKIEWKTLSKFAIPWTFFLVVFTVFLGDILNPLGSLERKWFDLKFNIPYYGRFGYNTGISRRADPKINIVAIDEFATEKYGWPFKRRYYSTLLENLHKYGVKSIAFDVMFMDQDRDNPQNDVIFVSSLKKYNNVINLLTIENYKLKKPIKGVIENSFYAAQPHADEGMDKDGKIRRMYPFYPPVFDEDGEILRFNYEDVIKLGARKCDDCQISGIPLLGLAAYAVYSDTSLNKLYAQWNEKSLGLNFRPPETKYKHQGRKGFGRSPENSYQSPFRHISVRDIIEDALSKEEKESLKGGIALIGATATGAFDHYPNPFLQLTPGVEFHATLIDNLIKDDYLRPVNGWLKFLLLLIAVWLPILLHPRSIRMITLSVAGFCFFLSGLSVFALKYNLDMNFVSYFMAVLVSYIYVMAYKSIVEGREKKWIKNTFSQYLSPKVVNIITEDPSKLVLGGEKRDMTIYFMDIAGFTSMSERLSPEELTKKLNYYLSELTEIILKYDGVVDKYIGDCIMAFWNAPLDQAYHRTMACKAAIECIRKLKALNEGNPPELIINMRVGINSGPAVVGNMGSNTRLSYTVIGDNVNLASRLEGANKFFHSRIMVSRDVYDEAKSEIYARFLGSIRVVGKAVPVDVYEPVCLLSEKEIMESPLYASYEKGVKYFYNKEYQKAAEFFSASLKADPQDGPSSFYLELSEKYSAKDEGFDGVFNLTSK
ncbi:MAG: adenylate/guanylate cyclase domain-containing protein [Elusimicrobiota bacterium]